MMLDQYSIIAWLQNNQIKTETGKPVDLSSHLFLYDFFTDWSQNIVCMKCAQIGFSTTAIYKTLWAVKHKKIDMIYTLPSGSDASIFVSGKVDRIKLQNPIITQSMSDKDSTYQKQIGDNMIYFRGTWNEQQAISVSADALVLDEYDRSKQDIIEIYSSRLQHSPYKWKWIFSNPSSEGVGVHKYWMQSDQKHWFIKCPHCQNEHYMDFPDSINFERKTFVCRNCKEDLPDEARRKGRWRKKYLDRKWSGYWINLLMAPWIDAEFIINEYNTKTPEYFENFVMGRPYVGGDAKLKSDDFFKNLIMYNKQDDPVVIGVDTGLPIWYVIGNNDGVFNHGSCPDYAYLDYLMTQRFPKAMMVIDAGGDPIGARKMLEKYPNRVFICYFQPDRKSMQLVQWGEGDEYGVVKADRNRMIQLVFDEFRDNRLPIAGTKEDYDEMFSHINNVYRTTVVDKVTKMDKYVYEGVKPDHLLFALVYWRIGISKHANFQQGQILDGSTNIVAQQGFILRNGFTDFL